MADKADAPLQPIHPGFRGGVNKLIEHLKELKSFGINYVAINLRFNRKDTVTTLHILAEKLLPEFS